MNKTLAQGNAPIEKRRLRMWIRMLRTARTTESQLRDMLRDSFDTTLPRFDVLAALYRADQGLKMNALSKQLLVSNGNVTGIVDRLEKDGMVKRVAVKNDRRSTLVCLSDSGRTAFLSMADQHAELINKIFDDVNSDDLDALADIFRRLKYKDDDDE
jgi:DNA-binding MarR family transcriptional regulator